MLKINKKKILAIVLLFLTILNLFQPMVSAMYEHQEISGSGSGTFMARQYATRIRTTDASNNTENGIIARRLIMSNQGWSYSNGDGIIVFCAQLGVPFETGTNYNGTYAAPSTSQLKQAAKIAYLGWYKDLGKYGSDGLIQNPQLKQYALTQQYIWESLRTK